MEPATGFTRLGVNCSSCGEPFSLTLGVANFRTAEELPDPFEARCYRCNHLAAYPKTQIGILAVVGGR
jgi:hypothetical protein